VLAKNSELVDALDKAADIMTQHLAAFRGGEGRVRWGVDVVEAYVDPPDRRNDTP
jgi:hypothetical protein